MKKEDVINLLSPPLDRTLCEKLIDNYVKAKEDQFLGRWADSITTYGKFLECVAKAIYRHGSSDNTEYPNCNTYTGRIKNIMTLTKSLRILLPTIIDSAYNIRNNRDAAHLSTIIDSNLLDCNYSASACDWIICELLVEFGNNDRKTAKNIIQSVLTTKIPIAFENDDGNLMVITEGKPAWQNALILLNSAKHPLTLDELSIGIRKSKKYTRDQLSRLLDEKPDFICILADGKYQILPKGVLLAEDIIKKELSV